MRRKEKEGFKPSRGHGDQGRPCPYTVGGDQPGTALGTRHPSPVDEESAGSSPYKYWNEDALSRWLGPENLGWAILDGIRTRVLGGQWCQSQLGDASLCLPAQPGGVPNLRAGPLPQSLLGSHSISRAGQWLDRAVGLHPDQSPGGGDAPL